MHRRSRLIRLVAVALSFALGACMRDLNLPPAPAGPTIQSFSPEQGYAGDRVLIKGTNFAPNPSDNEVLFNYATVRGDSFDHGALVVYVPEGPDTGTTIGPLAVSTPLGQSEATADTFNYYGIGHPNQGTKVGDVQVLHRAEGLAAAANGNVLLPSALFRRLLSRSGLNVPLAGKPHAIALSPDGATVFVGYADAGVQAFDPATGDELQTTAMDGLFIRTLLVGHTTTGGLVVHAIGTDRDFGVELQSFDGVSLEPRPARLLPVRAVRGAAIGSDGHTIFLVAERDGASGVERGVLQIDAEDATSAGSWFAPPHGADPTGPVAVAATGDGDQVAVALDDGTIALLDVTTAKWAEANVSTGSDTRVVALVTLNVPDGPLVAAAKPDDLSLVAIDPVAGNVAWTAWLGTLPSELAFDPTSGMLYANDDATNGIDEVDAASGTWLDRVVFDVGLGDADGTRFPPAADFDPGDEVNAHHMLVLSRKLKMLVPINDSTLELDDTPVALAGTSEPLGLVNAPDGTAYVIHTREVERFGGIHASEQSAKDGVIISGLDDDLTHAAVLADGGLALGSAHTVKVYEPDASNVWTVQGAGLSHPDGHLEELETRPDGNVLVLWQVTGDEPAISGGLWTPAGLAGGQPAIEGFDQGTDLHGYFGLVDAEPGPTLLFNWCDLYRGDPTFPGGRCAVRLGDQLGGRDLRFSNVKEQGPLIVTPDRRYFLWTRETTDDRVLRLAWAGDAGDDMYDFTSWQAAGEFKTPGLDPSGEWLYVPIPSLDEVSVFN